MPNIDWKQTKPQKLAWKYLQDKITTEILFGGGAGGGKSVLGCAWLILMAAQYEGSRWLLGRSVLKNLKETTLRTFFDLCKKWEINSDEHYKYNSIDGTIKFLNGSEILLKDLAHYPSDPNYDSLGSLEITGAYIDEANQVTSQCKDVVKSRIRYKLKSFCSLCYAKDMNTKSEVIKRKNKKPVRWKCHKCGEDQSGLIPKLGMSCNPAKNWTYSDFYKPSRDGTLAKYRAFVKALASDNPFIEDVYIEGLMQMKNKNMRERLLNGNWEYDDDPSCLFDFNQINDLFTNTAEESEERFMSVDVARFGKDKTVIGCWRGLTLYKIVTIDSCGTDVLVTKLEALSKHEKIRRSNCVVDEGGLGGGVVDYFNGCVGFLGSSKAIEKEGNPFENYGNLRAQAFAELANKADRGEIQIIPIENMDEIKEELEQIKYKDIDKDKKLYIIPKEKIKENLGRSPDYADMLSMRMIFELEDDGGEIQMAVF